ncbi:Pisatin demethylase [Madurella mycetomatis]|uniref:Pisatin demethylase n=1 Tax=Madurella mycetomatis TaxID=100816 RepID=A0A175WEQ6_9PEZI|nr:Pisatin demethylase [Madurella mycetomatis]
MAQIDSLLDGLTAPMLVFLAGATAAYLLTTRVWAWYRLRHIKGPLWAGWTDLWLIYTTARCEMLESCAKLCQQYGPLVRISTNYVVCGDAAEIRRIWAVRSTFDRADWWKGFQLDPPNDCSVSLRDYDIHHALRVKLLPGYNGRGVEGVHESIDAGVARFVRLIEKKYLSTETEYRPVDFAKKMQYHTIDLVSNIAFGEPFGFVEADQDLWGYIRQVHDSQPVFQLVCLMPWLGTLLQSPVGRLLQPSDKDVVRKRLAFPAYRVVLVSRNRWLQNVLDPTRLNAQIFSVLGSGKVSLKPRPNKRRWSRCKNATWPFPKTQILVGEADIHRHSLAGADTTSSAITAIIAQVITRSSLYRRLQQEIDEAVVEGRISSPVADAEARKLPFLQACIKEALRMWPPINSAMPKVSNEDAVVCGTHIPAGTCIAWAAKPCLCDPKVFGEDSEMYRPERWLLAEGSNLTAMENAVDLCFGAGKWVCLGRQLAYFKINKTLVELFCRFDFAVVDIAKPITKVTAGATLFSDFKLRITERSVHA